MHTIEEKELTGEAGFYLVMRDVDKKIKNLIKLFDNASLNKRIIDKYKSRLILGDGNFSFTVALVGKHKDKMPKLGYAIVATEYENEDALRHTFGNVFDQNLAYLKSHGVATIFNIDARTIDLDTKLPHKHFSRIHFNFPHDRSSYQARTLPKLIQDSFQRASKIQEPGDRVHMALPQPHGYKRAFYQSYVYGIFQASARGGYVLKKKRKFDEKRYPGYKHVKTSENESASVTNNSREFVFEKTSLTFDQISKHQEYRAGGYYTAYNEVNPYLREIPTDDESSSYDDGTSLRSFYK